MGLMHFPGDIEVQILRGTYSLTQPSVVDVWRKNPRAQLVLGAVFGRGGKGGDGTVYSGLATTGGGGGSSGGKQFFRAPAMMVPDVLFLRAANSGYATPDSTNISRSPPGGLNPTNTCLVQGITGSDGASSGLPASGGLAPTYGSSVPSSLVGHEINFDPGIGNQGGTAGNTFGLGQGPNLGYSGQTGGSGGGAGGASVGSTIASYSGGNITGIRLWTSATYSGGAPGANNGQDGFTIYDRFGIPLELIGATGGGSNISGPGGNGGNGDIGGGGGGGGAGTTAGLGGLGGPGMVAIISILR